MKVELEKQASTIAPSAGAAPRTTPAHGTNDAAPLGAADHASITHVASELAAKATVDLPPEATPARIAALKTAILDGTLRVDQYLLAQSMIDYEVGGD